MKNTFLTSLAIVVTAAVLCSPAWSDQRVRGYINKHGTYTPGYYRSSPNSSVRDNYSYKGNINPYTGATGSNYYRHSPSSEYYGTSPRR